MVDEGYREFNIELDIIVTNTGAEVDTETVIPGFFISIKR